MLYFFFNYMTTILAIIAFEFVYISDLSGYFLIIVFKSLIAVVLTLLLPSVSHMNANGLLWIRKKSMESPYSNTILFVCATAHPSDLSEACLAPFRSSAPPDINVSIVSELEGQKTLPAQPESVCD